MSLIVQKYGGTSVANPERIQNVAKRILETQSAGNQVVVVVSAMSGMTDNLIKLAKEVAPHPSEREMDVRGHRGRREQPRPDRRDRQGIGRSRADAGMAGL